MLHDRRLVYAAGIRAFTSTDYNIHDDIHKQHKLTLLSDKFLTKDEKIEAITLLNKYYDRDKIIFNSGTKRVCENCNQECLASLYCEYCVRIYLKENFSNWTGGFSEIYTAVWIDGKYEEWDTKKQQLIRFGTHKVILKRLENVESANRNWFEEAKSHLTISNKWEDIVRCYGLTQDPLSGNYMLYIGDLGFCGPADKSSNSIYGNLPYIAPEIIAGREFTFALDIYSIAMLMWEISSGKPPFINYEHDYYLAMNIINGLRPKIVAETPLEYGILMKQCWDADPLKRPDIKTLKKRIREIHLSYQSMQNELLQPKLNKTNSLEIHFINNKLFSSNIHQFGDLPEPKNATKEEQEEYCSESYDFSIPNNINDFDKLDNQNGDNSIKVNCKKLSKVFEMSQVNTNYDIRDYYKKEAIQQQIKGTNVNINDEDEIHNDPNLHSEEQDI
ncbi:hypothetical protein RclHR1_00020019 [Rhizophagus clarus]|uniref:Protein kinase domain-containing protein n=1 Tax=Rhizophagus clarus TaxID=94130 RepID=A0A2Z6RIW3_9GLOM|nr:hypothetical protein RclHR1_00020019 [Rhizophagus clarus]